MNYIYIYYLYHLCVLVDNIRLPQEISIAARYTVAVLSFCVRYLKIVVDCMLHTFSISIDEYQYLLELMCSNMAEA
uniref:Uncharacterized protein n=1 Tax=Arion vulgaris TaxID=1028688 RepID=A0A0B7B200_9EUPU